MPISANASAPNRDGHIESCEHCPERQSAYCKCFDTFLDESAGRYTPCYACEASESEEQYL